MAGKRRPAKAKGKRAPIRISDWGTADAGQLPTPQTVASELRHFANTLRVLADTAEEYAAQSKGRERRALEWHMGTIAGSVLHDVYMSVADANEPSYRAQALGLAKRLVSLLANGTLDSRDDSARVQRLLKTWRGDAYVQAFDAAQGALYRVHMRGDHAYDHALELSAALTALKLPEWKTPLTEERITALLMTPRKSVRTWFYALLAEASGRSEAEVKNKVSKNLGRHVGRYRDARLGRERE